MTSESILSIWHDSDQTFPPSETFRSQARFQTQKDYESWWNEAKDHPEIFWGREGRRLLFWMTPFSQAVQFPKDKTEIWKTRWFIDGKLNACDQAIDRNIKQRAQKPAILWQGENQDQKTITYENLAHQVSSLCFKMKALGVKKGDVVAISMPMVPELVVAILACARMGAIHTVIFGGFSPEAISLRLEDTKAVMVLTCDGGYRKGQPSGLKALVDEALHILEPKGHHVKHLIVLKRTGQSIPWVQDRDHLWPETSKAFFPPEPMDSEDPLFILYTSGSTGKPKGLLHSTAGYLIGAILSFQSLFDVREDDIFWCTADIGWITGHTYLTYGPLCSGATVVMYEGVPQYPDWGRFWKIIQDFRVTIFYTAPTAIRAFMQQGESWPQKADLSSLRLLGSVGEPINPEAWLWYEKFIGGGRCPVVDTWWQTETGSTMIASLPGVFPGKPGSAGMPFFGAVPMIVDQDGHPVPKGQGGFLILSQPWPSMCRTIWGDQSRYEKTYFKQGFYVTGDGARQDQNGYFWIMGRVDDVINVSGHRLSTMEIESALITHSNVAESAVVGAYDELKGQAVVCFVVLRKPVDSEAKMEQELKDHVVTVIGALARPRSVIFRPALPKTRSGKIMRRLLRDLAEGKPISGDMSTLDDPQSLLGKL